MALLLAKIRDNFGRKNKKLRENGIIPAVLYGPKIKTVHLAIDLKKFKKVFQEAGGSSMIKIEIEEEGKKKGHLALIYNVQNDPISGEPNHVDFYQPILAEEVEVAIPLVFEGESPAVKNLGGTLVKEIQEIEIKSLPQHIPHDIKVDISKLETFSDEILVKDLNIPEGIKVERKEEDVVAVVVPPKKAEEPEKETAEEEATQEEEESKAEEKE